MVRKHCGKRRNCSYEQFLLFPQCFQKTCTADTLKTRACLGKGYVNRLYLSRGGSLYPYSAGKECICFCEQFKIRLLRMCRLFVDLHSQLHFLHLNPSQWIYFRLFQSERVCRRLFKFDENGRKFSKKVENIVRKGEIAR